MLVYKEHVEEQSDVELEKIAEVFQRIVMVEKVMRDVLRPARINFAKFGNVASHLHWHIIPRFVGEIYTDKSPWELLATDELYKLPSRRPVNNIEMLMQSLKESLEIQ